MFSQLLDRALLEQLDALCVTSDEGAIGDDLEACTARAAAALLPLIVEHTMCEDAWYVTFTEAVVYYLMTRGYDAARVTPAVEAIVEDRFSSWIAPDDDTAHATCLELARAVVRGLDDASPDALAAWRAVRGHAFAHVRDEPVYAVAHDGHRAYIERFDRARDPDRAERLLAALELCRDSARGGLALTVDQLAEWQAVVLGASQPIELRTTDAFAKGGRERYGAAPDLRGTLEVALAEAGDLAQPVAVRAARVYLDLCFVHPFPDGNARAARLALDHVLTTAGLAIHAARPLFALSRAAGDGDGARAFARAIAMLCGPAAER